MNVDSNKFRYTVLLLNCLLTFGTHRCLEREGLL